MGSQYSSRSEDELQHKVFRILSKEIAFRTFREVRGYLSKDRVGDARDSIRCDVFAYIGAEHFMNQRCPVPALWIECKQDTGIHSIQTALGQITVARLVLEKGVVYLQKPAVGIHPFFIICIPEGENRKMDWLDGLIDQFPDTYLCMPSQLSKLAYALADSVQDAFMRSRNSLIDTPRVAAA